LKRVLSILAAVVLTSGASVLAQAPVTPGLPPPQVVPPTNEPAAPGQGAPPATVPDQQVPGTPPQTTPAAPGAPAAAVPLTRTVTGKTGMLFNTVRPERVKDFETVLWYLQEALKKSTDPTVRAQAEGWKFFRAVEPGPNAVVLYVFVLDPAVPGADYGLGRILADAFPEQIQEIWKLYQGSLTGGGTLLNLNPVEPMAPMPLVPVKPDPTAPPVTRTPPPPSAVP
jgi:hypothetical protein